MTISHERLLEILSYDPETGEFRRRIAYGPVRIGDRAGYGHYSGYRYIRVGGRATYAEHRLAWFYMTGEWPKAEIDHRNRVRDDNRFANLREATHGQNRANSRSTGVSGLKGACFHEAKGQSPNPWEAYITSGKRRHYLGRFATAEEAHAAYCAAARQAHGEFFNHGGDRATS